MLLHEKRGGRNQRHLLLVLNGFERRPHRNLSLSKPHVTGNQTIHRNGSLHVGFHLIDGGELVRRFHKRKRLFQLSLPGGVGRECKTWGCHPSGVELHQIDRELADSLSRLALRGSPIGASHFGQGRRITAHVVAQLVELVGRDIETIRWTASLAGRVFQDHKLALRGHGMATTGRNFPGDQLHKAPHAVSVVDDIVTSGELQRVHHTGALGSQCSAGPGRSAHGFAIELLLCDDDQL